MNISFVTKSNKAYERHILEHLMFYRTKNFSEKASFYEFLDTNGVVIDFYSRMDFMELTFYKTNEELTKIIKEEFESMYFTKEDFELEKRVIQIEEKNADQSKVDLYKKAFFKNDIIQSVFSKEYFENMTFENILELKEKTEWKMVEFQEKRYLEAEELDCLLSKDCEILDIKKIDDIVMFNFKHDKRLRELFIYIAIILSGKEYFIQRHVNFDEYSLSFYEKEFVEIFKNIDNFLEEKYDYAYDYYNKDFDINSVDNELFNMINMNDMIDKGERIKQIKKMFDVMYISFNNYENRN